MEVKVGEENHQASAQGESSSAKVVQPSHRTENGFRLGAACMSGHLKLDPLLLSAWSHSTSELLSKATGE